MVYVYVRPKAFYPSRIKKTRSSFLERGGVAVAQARGGLGAQNDGSKKMNQRRQSGVEYPSSPIIDTSNPREGMIALEREDTAERLIAGDRERHAENDVPVQRAAGR